jgi:mono/diheme cytochrome c family protein
MIKQTFFLILFVGFLYITACSPAGGDKRGHEFMPDMAHSTAYDANIYDYYYYNTWGSEEDYKEFAMPKKPVKGTIARGHTSLVDHPDRLSRIVSLKNFTGVNSPNAIAIPANGSVPYYYNDTEEERTRAMNEIIENPFPITSEGLAIGKELYVIYCGICHGDKGDGLGHLVREANPAIGDPGGVYPAAPANFLLDDFVNASNGRYYHSIMYGKNVMGSYADKLSYEERSQVIHYIRSLQAKDKGLKYNEEENTFTEVDVPGASIVAQLKEMNSKADIEEGHDGDEEAEGEHIGDNEAQHEEEHH